MICELCQETETRWPSLAFVERPGPTPLRFRIQPVLVCEGCSVGEFYYLIPAAGMIGDGYESWRDHMWPKTWFSARCVEALQKLARILGAYPIRRRQPVSGIQFGARCIPVSVRARVMERDNFCCRRCGAGPSERRLDVDHVQPVALGGSAEEDNLQTLCLDCNQGKRDNPPHAHDLALT